VASGGSVQHASASAEAKLDRSTSGSATGMGARITVGPPRSPDIGAGRVGTTSAASAAASPAGSAAGPAILVGFVICVEAVIASRRRKGRRERIPMPPVLLPAERPG
jgi:hypothetical protein